MLNCIELNLLKEIYKMKKGYGQLPHPKHKLVEVVLFGKKTQVLVVID